MVGNVRSANEKLLTRTLGVTETSIVLNIYARFVFPKFGPKCALGCLEINLVCFLMLGRNFEY